MKKIIRTLGLACLAGLFAVAVSSCKKTNDTTSVVITMEEIEEDYIGGERGYIDIPSGGYVYWNGGDMVRAYNLNMSNYQNSTTTIYQAGSSAQGQYTATFYGASLGTLQCDAYRFFYPVEMIAGHLGPQNCDTFTISDTQYYTVMNVTTNPHYTGSYATADPQAMPMATKHVSLNNFGMDHLFGYLRIQVYGTGEVESAVLTDPTRHLTGTAVMNLGAVDAARLKNVIKKYVNHEDAIVQQELVDYVYNPAELNLQTFPTGNTITLDCSDNKPVLDYEKPTPFVFAVRPGALDNADWTVTLNFSDGTSKVITVRDLLVGAGGIDGYDLRKLTMRPGRFLTLTRQL